jgi:hypothetical protein
LCRCSCGKEKIVLGDHLTRKDAKGVRSCGCLQQENRTKHGAFSSNSDIKYHVRYSLLAGLKDRSRRRGYESDLEISDIPEIPESCPVLGTRLSLHRNNHGKGKGRGRNRQDASPSIDRFNSNLPYLKKYKDNLCIISWRANKLKSDASLVEMKKVVEYLENWGTQQSEKSSLIDSKPNQIGGNEAEANSAVRD